MEILEKQKKLFEDEQVQTPELTSNPFGNSNRTSSAHKFYELDGLNISSKRLDRKDYKF